MNASSSRGGRQVLAQLKEATQSHHLGKAKHGKKVASNTRKGKESGVPLKRTALILFENVDLALGEQDEGFYSAVSDLIATTKRPIVLTASDPHFSARRRLPRCSEPRHFRFRPPPPASVARYLQLLCLVEGCPADARAVECVLARNGGDESRTMLELQYWTISSPSIEEVLLRNEEDDVVAQKKVGGGRMPLEDEDDSEGGGAASSEKAADSLAKLMSLSAKCLSNASPNPVRPLFGCVSALIGREKDVGGLRSKSLARSLFEDGPHGRDLFEVNILSLLPFEKKTVQKAPRKKFVPSKEACQRFKRIRTYDFLRQSSSDEESKEEGEDKVDKDEAPPQEKASKKELQNALKGLEQMAKCADVRSLFSLTSTGEEVGYGSVVDVSFQAQIRTLERCSLAIEQLFRDGEQVREELTVSLSDEDAAACASSLASAYRALGRSGHQDEEGGVGGWKRALEESTLEMPPSLSSVRNHATETVPTLREIARAEEVRRVSGDDKKSRSGRFLHYLDTQEIHLDQACLQALCDAFL